MRHSDGQFSGVGGLSIYYQRWLPDGEPTAVLVVAHGYAEHSGRYGNLVEALVPAGYAVWALDHRGHGRSGGERVQAASYEHYLDDLKALWEMAWAAHPGARQFLLGHSMGAAISTLYAARHQGEMDGLILSGGGIPTEKAPPRPANLDLAATLSRDPAVVQAYWDDPLVYRGPAPGPESPMAQMRERVTDAARSLTLPLLVMVRAARPSLTSLRVTIRRSRSTQR